MKSTLTPYLYFNGNCQEVMKFYQSVLGGELKLQTYAESGMPNVEDRKDQIMHAELKNELLSFMASDGMAPSTVGSNIHLSIAGSDEVALTKYFNQLSAGGSVQMPLAKQFWGATFGMFTDKFGIHWMVNITPPNP